MGAELSVAVVIATYNRADLLPRAITSALAQEPTPEVVVVDDGSTDATAEVVGEHPTVRYVCQENRERGAARNRGVEETGADLVAFLDSDDEFLPGHLRGLRAVMAGSGEIGLGYDQAEFVAPSGEVFFVAPDRPVRGRCFLEVARMNRFAFSSTMVRRSTFDRVGGFTEDRALAGAEDWELWARLAAVTEFGYRREPGVRIHFHGGNSVADADAHEAAVLEAAQRIHGHPRLRTGGSRARRAAAAGLAVTRARVRLGAGQPAEARRRLADAVRTDPLIALDPAVLLSMASTFRRR